MSDTLQEDTEGTSANEQADEIKLPDAMEEEILEYLLRERERVEAARANKKLKWNKWREQLEAQPTQKRRMSVLETPSQVSPPLAMIHGQTMATNLMSFMDLTKPFWTAEAVQEDNENDKKDAKFFTKYLWLLAKSPSDLNLLEVRRTIAMETATMGTEWVKIVWTNRPWNIYKPAPGGGRNAVDVTEGTAHDGPEIIPIPQEDAIYPPEWDSPEKMPWFDHVVHLPLFEVQSRAALGFYNEDVEDVISAPRTTTSEDEIVKERLEGYAPSDRELVDLDEFTFYWDIDGKGKIASLIYTIHVPTRTVVRRIFNRLGVPRVKNFRFIFRAFSAEGRGTGQICEYLQDEAEGIHNARNENIKMSAMNMLKMRRATSIANTEKLYTGKIWITDSPNEDVVSFKFGEEYSSSLQAENWTWSMAAQATGVSEVQRGFSDPRLGSRDTYRGMQMRMSQSRGLFNTTAGNFSEVWSEVAMLMWMTLAENAEIVLKNERAAGRLTEDEQASLARLLAVPVDQMAMRMKFSVATTDEDETFYDQQQAIMQLMQAFTQYSQQISPLAQMLFGPQGQQMQAAAPELYTYWMEIFVGATHFLRMMFKLSKIEDYENYIPDVRKQEVFLQAVRDFTTEQLNGRSDQRLAGPGANGSNSALPGAFGPPGSGGANGAAGGNASGGQGPQPGSTAPTQPAGLGLGSGGPGVPGFGG